MCLLYPRWTAFENSFTGYYTFTDDMFLTHIHNVKIVLYSLNMYSKTKSFYYCNKYNLVPIFVSFIKFWIFWYMDTYQAAYTNINEKSRFRLLLEEILLPRNCHFRSCLYPLLERFSILKKWSESNFMTLKNFTHWWGIRKWIKIVYR